MIGFIEIGKENSSADYTEHEDLSDSEKEDIIDDELALLKNKLETSSHLNKLLAQYKNRKGKLERNDLAMSILSYMYDLYLEDGNDLYSVYHVFDSKIDFILKVKEHTQYLGSIGNSRISEAYSCLNNLRCFSIKKAIPRNTEKFGNQKKYLVQIKRIKF
jgi:hypothetical protein